jgi:hypothetical protein
MSPVTSRGTRTRLLPNRRTVRQLLDASAKDTDAASVFWCGSSDKDSDDCIIVVKGRQHSDYIIDVLVRQKLVTPGKPVEHDK